MTLPKTILHIAGCGRVKGPAKIDNKNPSAMDLQINKLFQNVQNKMQEM